MSPIAEQVAGVQRAMGGHVDAAALHTAVTLDLPRALAAGPLALGELAAAAGVDADVIEPVLELLASTGLLARHVAGTFELADGLLGAVAEGRGVDLAAASVDAFAGWSRIGGEGAAGEVAAAVQAGAREVGSAGETRGGGAARAAARVGAREAGSVGGGAAPAALRDLALPAGVAEVVAGAATAAALMQLADRGLLSAIAGQPATRAELAGRADLHEDVLEALLAAACDAGVLERDGERMALAEAAHQAFGRGVVRGHVAWAERRLVLDRRWFWEPLGRLAGHARGGPAPSHTSAPGRSGGFRRDFTATNRPLLALLRATARAVARDLDTAASPLRVLELGPSLGWWGVELAATHAGSTVTAVDAAEVLPATRAHVAAAGLSERYAWHEDACHAVPAGEYDVVVVNELWHTFERASLPRRLEDIARALSPRGLLLVADMVLDASRTRPVGHLRSALKLRATGGGRVHAVPELGRLLRDAGLGRGRLYRLGTTDLLAVTRGRELPGALVGRPAEAV